MQIRTTFCASFLLLAVAPLGCGGTPAEAIRPKDPTYAGASGADTGAKCTSVGDEGKPLVVDWKPEERVDLQAALSGGVAIVHYDCEGIKLLPDCKLEGSYGYVGTTTQEQVIALDNADEVKMNLPLNGAKLGAGMARNASLDIGVVLIGKLTTTAVKVSKSQLSGRCDGATHFVRDATVGGFAMSTGTMGKVTAVADLFGKAGISGGSESNQAKGSKSGDLAVCRANDVDAQKPPQQCGAPVRLRLLALSGEGAAADSAAAPPAKAGGTKAGGTKAGRTKGGTADTKELDLLLASLSCPAGMTFAAGKCTSQMSEVHTCKAADQADCTKQCTAGDNASCGLLGQMLYTGKGAPVDKKQAAVYLDKACHAGIGHACYYLGNAIVSQDNADLTKEYAAFAAGCNLGDSESCRQAAGCLEQGEGVKESVPKAMALYVRACDAGSVGACDDIGENYLSGLGVPKDENLGLTYLERACFGGRFQSCTGGDSDAEMKRNSARHLRMAEFACRSGYGGGCADAADAYSAGGYAKPNPAKVSELRAKHCALNKNACKK